MDISIVLSIVAIFVSVILSGITLLLTEFRGPNILLLNKKTKFQLINERYSRDRPQEYTPVWLDLKVDSLVFTNSGGRAGTILRTNIVFTPETPLQNFFERFSFRLEPDLPYTLEEGDNQHFKVSSEIRTIDWKRAALVAILDPSLKINDMIAMALKNSKEEFRNFCHLLSKSNELGRVSCIAELTKGRFRTRIAEVKQFENLEVKNNQEVVSLLMDCLLEWENLKPTAAELLNKMERDLDGIQF
jgi:hypothetical protein